MITKLIESFTQEINKTENKNVISNFISTLLYNYRPIFYICILFFITIIGLQMYQIYQIQKIVGEKIFA